MLLLNPFKVEILISNRKRRPLVLIG